MTPILGIWASAEQALNVPNSFESIATVNASGSTGQINFTSIPSTYKHLQIRAITNGTDISRIRVGTSNSIDTNSNYSRHALSGDGSSVSAYGVATDNLGTFVDTISTTNIFNGVVCDILDYSNTNKNKTIRVLSGYDANGSGIIQLSSTAWYSTSAIDCIRIFMPTGNYNSNSRFALYGVKG